MCLHNIYTYGLKHQIGKLIKADTNRGKQQNGDLIYDQPRPTIYSNVMLMLTYFITIEAKNAIKVNNITSVYLDYEEGNANSTIFVYLLK